MWHVTSQFQLLAIFEKCPCKIDFNAQCPKRRSKCPVIIWVCIDDKKWSRKDVTCHVHYFYPSFFLWHLGSSCRNFGQTWQAPTTAAAQKHRVIYALRHWHRRKTLHSDLFLRISFGKYIVSNTKNMLRFFKLPGKAELIDFSDISPFFQTFNCQQGR